MNWRIADTLKRFIEIVRRAFSKGTQRARWRGSAVLVVSEADHERMTERRGRFVDFLADGSSLDDVDVARDRTPARAVDL